MEGVFQRHNSPMLLIDPDGGQILDANRAATRFYGYDDEHIRQLRISDINVHSPTAIHAEMQRAAAEERNFFQFRHRLADGELRDVEVHSSPVRMKNKELLFSIIYDISERRRTELALARSRAISASMLEAIPLPVFFKDCDGLYQGCNRAFARLTGHPPEKIINKTVFEVWPPELALIYHEHDQALLESFQPVQIYETRLKDEDGALRDVIFHKAHVHDEEGRVAGLIGVILDITERKRSEEHSRQLAHYDALTGLPNRRLINQRLQQALSHSADSSLHGALVFLDLDNFKPLNDEHGHDAGDQLLIEVGQRLKQCVRANDTVGRLAGDEFVVILQGLDEDLATATAQAQQLAEKVRLRLNESYDFTDFEHHCSASIGIALFHGRQGLTIDELFKQADSAMYAAKAGGRNCSFLYQNPH